MDISLAVWWIIITAGLSLRTIYSLNTLPQTLNVFHFHTAAPSFNKEEFWKKSFSFFKSHLLTTQIVRPNIIAFLTVLGPPHPPLIHTKLCHLNELDCVCVCVSGNGEKKAFTLEYSSLTSAAWLHTAGVRAAGLFHYGFISMLCNSQFTVYLPGST